MSFENSVTFDKCDHNIYMLFEKLNNISQKFIDKNMSYKQIICHIRKLHVVQS